MADFNGSGKFVRSYNWVTDKSNSVAITASRFDTEDDGIASGLSTTICKDGQSTTSGRIPFAVGIKLNNGAVGTPSAAFNNETDSGLYRIASHNLGLAINATKVWDFGTATASAAGSLVIGTRLTAANGGIDSAGLAWASYTATATAATGSLGSPSTSATQVAMGKTQLFQGIASFSKGSGSGALLITLPATANTSAIISARSVAADGSFLLWGQISAAGTTVSLLQYDGTTKIGNDTTVYFAGVYEKQ